MKYLRYILFIMILFLVPNVYALEVDVTNIITSPETSGQGKYRGTEILNTGGQFTYNVKTRYQGRLSRIIYNLPLPSDLGDCYTTNATYTVTMYMETNDWNNKFGTVKVRPYSSSSTNWSNGTVTYVSYKKIYFTFKIPSSDTTCYDFVWIDLPSTNLSNTGITQISNWNLNKVTLTDPTISTGGSSGGSSGGSGTVTDPNQSVIDANNQNTQDIIENDDQNTQDIISSIQETTSQVSETITNTFSTCQPSYNLFDTSQTTTVLNQNGDARTGYFFHVPETGTYYLYFHTNGTLYWGISSSLDSATTLIGSTSSSFSTTYNLTAGQYLIMWPTKGSTDELMIAKGSQPLPFKEYGDNTCTNKIDELNDKLDGLGRVIEDSQVDDKSSFFTGFQDNAHGLTGIITLPLSTIQTLTNTSCVALSIPIPFTNESVSLPCMTEVYQNYVPTVFSLWQVVSFGIISYFICLDIFKMVKGFKDPNEDKVEVLDL